MFLREDDTTTLVKMKMREIMAYNKVRGILPYYN